MIAAALLVTSLLAPFQGGPDAGAIVERAAQAFQALESFRADFRQVIADSMIGTFASRGRLWQEGTSRFAMRFTDPRGEAIVMDGQAIWVYTPSTTPGQVLKYPMPRSGEAGPNVLAWLLDRPGERYESRYLRTEQLAGRYADVVTLTPRDPSLPFRQATLWLDQADHLPRQVELVEQGGNRRTLTLSNLRVNTKAPEGTFAFQVPSGVRVIEQ